MAVAREPEGDEVAKDPMINKADWFVKGDEAARDPMINRDGRFVKGDEIDRGVRGRIFVANGTKIMKIIFGYILHTVGMESQSGKRAWWSTRMKMMRGKA